LGASCRLEHGAVDPPNIPTGLDMAPARMVAVFSAGSHIASQDMRRPGDGEQHGDLWRP
jgi:hypothetical protein